jgi:hypothetical protein
MHLNKKQVSPPNPLLLLHLQLLLRLLLLLNAQNVVVTIIRGSANYKLSAHGAPESVT